MLLYMGIFKSLDIKTYWITDNLFKNNFVLKLLNYKRFTIINIHTCLVSIDKPIENEKRNHERDINKIIGFSKNCLGRYITRRTQKY